MSDHSRQSYLLEAMNKGCSNGDAYVTADTLYALCREVRRTVTSRTFRSDLGTLLHSGALYMEGRRVYLGSIWRYEESAAKDLSSILLHSGFTTEELPETLRVGSIVLCEEQRNAVATALSNRLTLILGGAGCGKSTLIRSICDHVTHGGKVLCAPTGKAARNLTARTGLPARTVHSALGLAPNDDFLSPVAWNYTKLVIVDEASMLSLDMLAGILHRAKQDCRIVLLGDSNQLLSVGVGNVIPDLLLLGVPVVRLETNHRQASDAYALLQNVVHFNDLARAQDLAVDDSFLIHILDHQRALRTLIYDASQRYLNGENIQVLAPLNQMVNELNQEIREQVNPLVDGKHIISANRFEFRDGDRVMITQNNRDHNCSNGDVGILHIEKSSYSVELPDGRCPQWYDESGLFHLTLAYALTVHKSQGSEYDAVLMPLLMNAHRMLSRNLFYTAISRGKQQVVLYGDMQAIDVAMQRALPARKSMLVAKAHMQMHRCA